MAVFSLEALRAKHGDALIVHFADGERHRLLVIDGGPSGVNRDALTPRLTELRQALAPGGRLPVELLMISHIDDDHIRGVLDLTEDFLENPLEQPFIDVAAFWHNGFDDLAPDQAIAGAVAEAPARVAEAASASTWRGDAAAVVASVKQGRQLKDNAKRLHWPRNEPFGEFVMAPGGRPAVHEVGGLKLLVVGPRARELEKLRKEWRDWVAKLRAGNEPAIRAAENLDQSVFNLSSIVCLAEFGGKRMLLTGDARGDLILGGLEEAALIEPGEELKLDLLKLPHHGSDRNVDAEFFARLPADHYVASGNGVHGNPEVDTLRMISTARPKDDFTLHLTYEDCEEGVGAELAQFFAAEKRAGRGYEVVFRDPDDLSLRVDLLGELSV